MELKDIAWNNAHKIEGQDPKKWRKDACGAWICYDCYDKTGRMFAWQIDHIFPKSVLEKNGVPQELIDHPDNVRALATRNNLSKSDNYPVYKRAYIFQGGDNVEIDDYTTFAINRWEVNSQKQEALKKLYKDYISDFRSGELNPR